MSVTSPAVTLLYHYFHPDDVISARLFSDLAEELAARGWRVTAAPSNRSCRKDALALPLHEQWGKVSICRVWRPGFQQSSGLGRLLNAAWMVTAWSVRALGSRRGPEVVIVGTDPILAALVVPFWRLFRPGVRVVHWCHDLYPEAAVADGLLRPQSLAVRLMRWAMRQAYRRCDVIADLGSCMRELLATYSSPARQVTLTPWSLVEPEVPPQPDPDTRRELFGDAQLTLLYSGNFGRAHEYGPILALAQTLRSAPIHFCFACRGNRVNELRAAVGPEDTNISFAGFASESELEKRLSACDAHVVTLRPEWTGTVVPSKFFGALAAGRPVLFSGAPDSSIARWITQHQVGWVLTPESIESVATDLRRLADDPSKLGHIKSACHRLYRTHFSREHVCRHWHEELTKLVRGAAAQ